VHTFGGLGQKPHIALAQAWGFWPKEQIGTVGDRLRAQFVDKARAEPASATDNPLSEFAALRGLDPGDLQHSSAPASLRPGHETGEPDC
jgi:hypothetical protein